MNEVDARHEIIREWRSLPKEQRAGKRLSTGRSFALSGAYVLAMAAAYGRLGFFVAWFGGNLQAILQTPVAIVLMSLVFVARAMSMFGLYEKHHRVPPADAV